MKKLISMLVVFVFILSLTTGLKADEKELNVIGNVGFAFSDLEGLFIDLGVEKQFKDNIWAQLFIDYYLDPAGLNMSAYGVDASLTMMGLNLYGVFKKELRNKLTLFVKAGPFIAFSKASVSYMGFSESESATDFGIGGGSGVEYALKEKLSIVVGATLKLIFDDGTANWFKLYAGVNYKLK